MLQGVNSKLGQRRSLKIPGKRGQEHGGWPTLCDFCKGWGFKKLKSGKTIRTFLYLGTAFFLG